MTKQPNRTQNQSYQNQNQYRKFKISIIYSVFLAVLFIFPAVTAAQTTEEATSTDQFVLIATSTLPNGVFLIPEVKAISAVVYDPLSKTFLFEKNKDEVRHLASLTKILTAIVTRDFVLAQRIPTKIVSLNKINLESKIDRELKLGERWNVEELLRFMLTTSSNTAAEAIGSQIIPYSSFLSLMNYKVLNLGLTSIQANNTSGLPIKITTKNKVIEAPGAVGSAKDMALLMAEAYRSYPNLIKYTSNYRDSFTSTLNGKRIARVATSTNELLGIIPNIIGGKTGYTLDAGGNLAVVYMTDEMRPIIIVVLGSTVNGRFDDVTALASSTSNFFTLK